MYQFIVSSISYVLFFSIIFLTIVLFGVIALPLTIRYRLESDEVKKKQKHPFRFLSSSFRFCENLFKKIL